MAEQQPKEAPAKPVDTPAEKLAAEFKRRWMQRKQAMLDEYARSQQPRVPPEREQLYQLLDDAKLRVGQEIAKRDLSDVVDSILMPSVPTKQPEHKTSYLYVVPIICFGIWCSVLTWYTIHH